MTNLMRASNELFKRSPDEVYESLQTLYEYCSEQKNAADSDQDISSLQERLLITSPDGGQDNRYLRTGWVIGHASGSRLVAGPARTRRRSHWIEVRPIDVPPPKGLAYRHLSHRPQKKGSDHADREPGEGI